MLFRTDPEFVRQVRNELYNQKAKAKSHTVKLPCGHGFLEVPAPSSDLIKLECPKCKKTHYLIWSAIGNHKWRERNK